MKPLSIRTFQVAVCASLCVSAQAGLIFNITYTAAVQNDSNFANVQNAINYVTGELSGLYSDPVTLNFTVDEGAVGLGQSLFSNDYYRGSYATLRTALIGDATSADDATATALANLPATDPYSAGLSGWYATSAEAKALGLIAGDRALSDGTFTFDNSVAYTFDPSNRQVAGKYDFIGVTEHELTELMGRTAQSSQFGYNILDTMRFTAAGTRQGASAANVYFSFDNGNTNLAGYNGGAGDRQDLNGAVASDPFNASTGTGQGHLLNAMDIRTMDVIGWDLAAPEPGTSALIGLGLLGIAGFRVRRKVL